VGRGRAAGFPVGELHSRRPLIPDDLNPDAEVRDVLETFRTIAAAPPGSLGAYVITMTQSASDVLAVVVLQRRCASRRRCAWCRSSKPS
jgi:phosphoenolpyruvate carboxylase